MIGPIWKCEACRHESESNSDAIAHELGCEYHPDNKGCRSCRFYGETKEWNTSLVQTRDDFIFRWRLWCYYDCVRTEIEKVVMGCHDWKGV